MDYTPRQVQAFVVIAQRRKQEELRQQLLLGTLAARGEENAIRAQLKEWDN